MGFNQLITLGALRALRMHNIAHDSLTICGIDRLPFERGEVEHLALLFKRIWQPQLEIPLLAWAGELQKPLLTETRLQ